MFSSSRNKPITLIVVTTMDVLRADLVGGEIKRFERAERPENTVVTSAVELAVSLIDAKPSKRTVVLADDFWTGIIDVDDRSIYGLEGNELNQMLKFETESLSNLDPMNSQLGLVELAPVPPDTRRFWCTGVAAEVVNNLATIISLRGGKLWQIGTPLGLAGPNEDAGWTEFRSSIAGAFDGSPSGLPRASITPRSNRSDRWFSALEMNFGGELPSQGWLVDGSETHPQYFGQLQPLASDDSCKRWIVAAAKRLGEHSLPFVDPPVPETPAKRFNQVGTAAAVFAVFCCLVSYLNQRSEFSYLQEQIDAIEAPAAEQRQLKQQLSQTTKQVREMEEQLGEVKQRQRAVEQLLARRDRFSVLLRLIAQGRDDSLVVDEITSQNGSVQVTGRAIESQAASQLAMKISQHAGAIGWSVQPPELTGQNKTVSGGPWTFTIELVDSGKVQAQIGSGGTPLDTAYNLTSHQSPGVASSSNAEAH